jgi:hypothetical protein
MEMLKTVFLRLKKKALAQKDAKPKDPEPPQASPYTDEEARKVKERLQGLGYID